MKLPTKEQFKALYSSQGNYAYQLMFWEMSVPAKRLKYPPVFTMKQEPYMGLPSAYLVYMDSVDEYDAATKLAPNMKVWDELCGCSWFMNENPKHAHQGLKVWREHMKQRDASLAKSQLMAKAKEGDTTAAKALLAETKTKVTVGRKNNKVTKPKVDPRVVAFRKKQGD